MRREGGGLPVLVLCLAAVAARNAAAQAATPIGRLGVNIYAPLHQVITCLGWTPAYDLSMVTVPADPRLTVVCTPPFAGAANP